MNEIRTLNNQALTNIGHGLFPRNAGYYCHNWMKDNCPLKEKEKGCTVNCAIITADLSILQRSHNISGISIRPEGGNTQSCPTLIVRQQKQRP